MIDPAEPTCPICAYRLHGLPRAGRCPECGSAYNPRVLAQGTSRPRGGWFILLLVPISAAAAALGLVHAVPPGLLVTVLCLGGCWALARRVAVWRYETLARAHLLGDRPLPPPWRRRLVHHAVFGSAVLLTLLAWIAMA
jgi:hypothetical protein